MGIHIPGVAHRLPSIGEARQAVEVLLQVPVQIADGYMADRPSLLPIADVNVGCVTGVMEVFEAIVQVFAVLDGLEQDIRLPL